MVCESINVNGTAMIVCGPRKRARKCSLCGRAPVVLECDYPTPTHKSKTCDKPPCAHCAVHVGPDLDYCRDHDTKVAVETQTELGL